MKETLFIKSDFFDQKVDVVIQPQSTYHSISSQDYNKQSSASSEKSHTLNILSPPLMQKGAA
jgi:hypothetical protein